MPTPDVPLVPLLHGALMPQIGLGTWPLDDDQTAAAILEAVEAGYRSFDTAENYGNERGVGRGIRASGLARETFFVTTKFNRKWHGRQLVADAFAASADRLGVDYVDLLLIHWPNPDQDRYVDAWEGLVQLLEAGRVRAIGVSNFKPAHLERIISATGVAPDVNQIRLQPDLARRAAREYHAEHAIVTESWAPLGGSRTEILGHPVIVRLAEEHGRTPGQVVLRWHVQLGLVTVPKTANPARMAENIDVFDFELSPDDLAAVAALDRGEAAVMPDSDVFGH